MQNCVFVDDHDAVDKVEWLLDRPEQLSAIIEAGRLLVQSRHTMAHRDEIRQWLELRERRRPGERIVQVSPFDGLRLVGEATGLRSHSTRSEGPLQLRLQAGDAARLAGNLDQAAANYRVCLEYVGYMPEPIFGLALCSLYAGDARAALSWLKSRLAFALGLYDAEDPDPVEWAYFLIALAASGRVADARRFAAAFPALHHTELDRTRWAIDVIANGRPEDHVCGPTEVLGCRRSLHEVVQRSFERWVAELAKILVANGRGELATRIEQASLEVEARGRVETETEAGRTAAGGEDPDRVRRALRRWRWRQSIRDVVESRVRSILHATERRVGYFLPYRYSAIKHHPLFVAMRDLLRDRQVAATLVVSDSEDTYAKAAISIAGSSSGLQVVSTAEVERREPKAVNTVGETECARRDVTECIFVNLVARDTRWECGRALERELLVARIVLVIGTSRWEGFDGVAARLRQADFRPVLANPALDGGCAVFVKGPSIGTRR